MTVFCAYLGMVFFSVNFSGLIGYIGPIFCGADVRRGEEIFLACFWRLLVTRDKRAFDFFLSGHMTGFKAHDSSVLRLSRFGFFCGVGFYRIAGGANGFS